MRFEGDGFLLNGDMAMQSRNWQSFHFNLGM